MRRSLMRPSNSKLSAGRAAAVSLALVVAFIAGAAVLATARSAGADAPRRQARETHIGQRLDDFVVLNMINPTTTPIFVRCHDDGTRDTTEFSVPTGSKMVVTDVDWLVTGSNLTAFATLRLFVEKSSTRCLAALLTGATSQANSGGFGSSAPTFGTTGVLTGFVVGAGARVVSDLRTPQTAVSSGTTIGTFPDTNATVVLRGYLVKDE
jgi:hypothetical protein